MNKRSILERIATWHDYAESQCILLEAIFIHPDDLPRAPDSYKGLPVRALSDK